MKKLFYIFGLAILVAACAKTPADDNGNVPSDGKVKFTAAFGEGSDVKTSLSGTKVSWVEGDEISILWDGGSTTSKAAASGVSTEFVASVGEADNYYGIYPSSISSSYTSSTLTVNIPATQHGSFAESNIIVAETTAAARAFTFKNVCSIGKFALSRSDIASVTFKANNNAAIAGGVTLVLDGSGIPTASGADETQIEIVPSSGDAFAAGTYYFALVPGTLAGGIEFKATTKTGNTILGNASENDATMKRATVINFGTLDSEGSPSEMQLKFDFTIPAFGSDAAVWKSTAAYSPNGESYRDVQRRQSAVYTLDGTNYSFVLADCDGANSKDVFWTNRATGATNCIFLKSSYRYFGFPAITGYKLTKAEFVCERYSSNTAPQMGVVNDILGYIVNPYDGEHASVVIAPSLQEWGATGTTESFTLSGTTAGTVYYLFAKEKGGFQKLTLTYSK